MRSLLAQPSLLDSTIEATDANMVRASLPEENHSTEGSFRRGTHAPRHTVNGHFVSLAAAFVLPARTFDAA